MINFRLAELRKKHNLTQQELGDILSVSYQTISKWETGVVSPDISYLPHMSSYFGVSIDALLGLVPLEEEYKPSNSGTVEYWNGRLEYLKRTRKTMWNEDYIQFLIDKVWKIDKPITILDCGCGYGALGLLIMPLLPLGSKYVGIDFSEKMIHAAKEIFQDTEYDVRFIMNHGMSRKEAEDYCRQQNGIVKFLKENKGSVSLTKTNGIMISYGWK